MTTWIFCHITKLATRLNLTCIIAIALTYLKLHWLFHFSLKYFLTCWWKSYSLNEVLLICIKLIRSPVCEKLSCLCPLKLTAKVHTVKYLLLPLHRCSSQVFLGQSLTVHSFYHDKDFVIIILRGNYLNCVLLLLTLTFNRPAHTGHLCQYSFRSFIQRQFIRLEFDIISHPTMNSQTKIKQRYLICSDVDLLREPVACWTEGSSNVSSFHHLHQVSDDLGSISYTHTNIILKSMATISKQNCLQCLQSKATEEKH